ncbi:hypothetical protein Hoch_5076 [Haliangium ochraceum DSM 14365]|uniref:Uncharacterized protein n=2 Tax=Haliangium ochraceum TaxID=80816 RepID=D0LVK3_HALO1|nr:hypothetical protein Hoch_5076 [Haliangium ochraceum DSM 14365]
MDLRRLPAVDAHALGRLDKYHRAWTRLAPPAD